MTAYENITAVLDRIEKVSRKGLNYVIELEDIEQLQEAQEQVKNNDLLHSVSDPVKEAYQKGFNDGASAAADAIAANPERL